VIVDEGSRLTPAESIPAVYRGAALIVFGDDRQLPPTSYYDRPDETPADSTSLLEPARRALTTTALTTHYRSRDEALIAFADHAYYQGRLTVFPRADTAEPDFGVELFPVEGVYRRDTAKDNPIEAAAVAERVLHHLAYRPDQTLGVVTLAEQQADAIRDAVEQAVGGRPEHRGLFDGDRTTGFFVKCVEAAQGDERDVIILSVGYGYDEHDKISTNLGALTRPKGWRRLNVAITRARRRIEVVSSLRSGDVPDLGNETVRHLKAYLDFAEHGTPAPARPADEPAATPFEDSVLATIRSWGFRVRPQVGAAGHRIDLAVLHPDYHDEVYAIGVECDGPGYLGIPAVRDRDRLREEILHDLGWTMHRIWATAWYRNRTQEESRLLGAIERAVETPAPGRPARPVSGVDDLPRRAEHYRRIGHQLLTPEHQPGFSAPSEGPGVGGGTAPAD